MVPGHFSFNNICTPSYTFLLLLYATIILHYALNELTWKYSVCLKNIRTLLDKM